MAPTREQIIRVHGVLAIAKDNCLRLSLPKKKRVIKIKTEVGKRKLRRSYQDLFQPTAFDRSDYELFMNELRIILKF